MGTSALSRPGSTQRQARRGDQHYRATGREILHGQLTVISTQSTTSRPIGDEWSQTLWTIQPVLRRTNSHDARLDCDTSSTVERNSHDDNQSQSEPEKPGFGSCNAYTMKHCTIEPLTGPTTPKTRLSTCIATAAAVAAPGPTGRFLTCIQPLASPPLWDAGF